MNDQVKEMEVERIFARKPQVHAEGEVRQPSMPPEHSRLPGYIGIPENGRRIIKQKYALKAGDIGGGDKGNYAACKNAVH
jgi:hypothetical protein